MRPEEFAQLGQHEEVILTYRDLQVEYSTRREQWAQQLEAGTTQEERRKIAKDAFNRAAKLAQLLFELPEGAPNAGEVTDVPEEDSYADPDITYQQRTLQTQYGEITIFKYAEASMGEEESAEFRPAYAPDSAGAKVTQALRFDEDPLVSIIDTDNKLYAVTSSLFPEVHYFQKTEEVVDMLDALDTMERIAAGFGI
jgi:hypothetical protein